METCFCSFFDKTIDNIVLLAIYKLISFNFLRDAMHMQLMHRSHMCAPTNGVQQPVHSAPSVFPTKKRRWQLSVMLKAKLKRTIPG